MNTTTETAVRCIVEWTSGNNSYSAFETIDVSEIESITADFTGQLTICLLNGKRKKLKEKSHIVFVHP